MNPPRPLSRRLALALGLGCALLMLSPPTPAFAQKKMPPPVTLTPALLDQVEKVTKLLSADADAKTELDAINHDDTLDPTVADTDDAMLKKYPRLASVYNAAGLKPHEFVGAFITLLVAHSYVQEDKPADAEMTQANIDFAKANQERIKPIVKVVTGQDH